ncbi:transcription termination factor NusA [Butyrivibrio sp. AE2032]|uniref:transcription termination factor NusA n=1 Tax=Butyrivibrio sp. AE2032 TaxID=1458463 RepID=UPI0005532575|nr:transcription termination factor NusA [Butyrivibrio sp. AE2032]
MPRKKNEEEPKDTIVSLVKLLAEERDIDEEEVFQAIESGLVAAYRREFRDNDNKEVIKSVNAEIDRETGEIYLYKLVEVVEEVVDEANEISLEAAKEQDEDVEVGDEIELAIDVEDLGRLAASAAKNAINQKLRDAESAKIEQEFSGKIGEITSGTIVRRDARNVYVNIGRAEAVVKHDGQIRNNRNEHYDQDRIMKFLVMGVEEANGRPSVVLSRTDARLVTKLFELEVPEIKAGDVIIRSVAREAGSRTKIAVYSKDPDIDAKGSCVGQRGQRVQQIMNELAEEKIDIVDWKEDPALFISEALQPAKVSRVDTEITTNENGEVERYAKVIVPDQQFSLAIGKSGQNVRLAARLTGFKIDIKKESDESVEASKALIDDFKVVDDETGKEDQ